MVPIIYGNSSEQNKLSFYLYTVVAYSHTATLQIVHFIWDIFTRESAVAQW